MKRNRPYNYSRQGGRDPLERRMDQWFETGRQFVDGVAGNRPGQRKGGSLNRTSRSSLDNLGRWVGDKIDWFLEDEDDWVEPYEFEKEVTDPLPAKKQALSAISLRVPKSIAPSSENNEEILVDEEWPQQSAFRIDRWQRSDKDHANDARDFSNSSRDIRFQKNKRPLPKSNRKRN